MSGVKDGFKRGTNYCHRMRMAELGAIQCAEIAASLARAATVITPVTPCARCGHLALQHDLDRTTVLPGQGAGGEGCLDGWETDAGGCDCTQFVVDRSAQEVQR
jgi:hypothetical protein